MTIKKTLFANEPHVTNKLLEYSSSERFSRLFEQLTR